MNLNIEERIELLDGKDVWRLKTFEKLKPIMMADGPHGLRKQNEMGDNLGIGGSTKAVCYPTASMLAATFDKNLIQNMAKNLAHDAKSQDVQIILGPGINVKRNPLCGRNFEYFSEDPFLTGVLAKAYVEAIENEGVGTSVKHFFANNQEKNRLFIDAVVDTRALNEIYLKAFKMAVEANPASIMASYNKINGHYGSQHPYINDVLRKKWQYKGIVVSDWGATVDRVKALKRGLDLEMPSSRGYGSKKIKEALEKDPSLEKNIMESSDRILNLIDKYQSKEQVKENLAKHHQNAIEYAKNGLVLLKNEDNILPIKENDKVLFVGGFIEDMRFQGGGSSYINPYKVDQVYEIHKDYFPNSEYAFGYPLYTDAVDELLSFDAIEYAKTHDKVVYFMGLPERYETEGIDRTHINVPQNQLILLEEILKINSNVVVVLITGSVVDVSFKDKVKGLLLSYLGGEGVSHSILSVLKGHSPSGRLPETWIKSLDALPFKIKDNNNAVYYDESIFIGYRYYESFDIEVNYPFGYGLSYADFIYSDFAIESKDNHFEITFKLKNKSSFTAKEVIQVYLERFKSKTYQPKKVLVAFDKVELQAGEENQVLIRVDRNEFKYYDLEQKEFVMEGGNYKLHVSKNVKESIHSFDIEIEGATPIHELPWKMYNPLKFKDVYYKQLPPENIEYKRPFTMESPLFALEYSFVGRMIVKMILKEATKKVDDAVPWIKDNIRKTLLEMPIRCLASFGGDSLNFTMAEGLVDLANLKLISGLKKYKKGQKELNNE
ncbi:MAG TPA: beta-glucosidase [Acholeplasma sp.]|nr:beta-glucosidase [Acholeplasma sp.]